MAICKADDVSHVRFRAPNLDCMKDFLHDFGFVAAEERIDRLFMRGYGTQPFIHATDLGHVGFIAFGIRVRERAELDALAAHDGCPVEKLDAPGGGSVVRLQDPDGFLVEVVWGQESAGRLPTPEPFQWNEAARVLRSSELRRIEPGPSHVLRLGHVVLSVSDFRRSEAWYKERFGFITSDEISPAPGIAIGAFMRTDRGDERTSDHHTLFLLQHPDGVSYLHSAFEVVDLDDLMVGHQHLLDRWHRLVWGVGRHLLGSQIFDYWLDPWGNEVEHWTDGDQLRKGDGSSTASPAELMSVQWGMPFPDPV